MFPNINWTPSHIIFVHPAKKSKQTKRILITSNLWRKYRLFFQKTVFSILWCFFKMYIFTEWIFWSWKFKFLIKSVELQQEKKLWIDFLNYLNKIIKILKYCNSRQFSKIFVPIHNRLFECQILLLTLYRKCYARNQPDNL